MLAPDVEAPDVVQATVVGFSDERVHAPDVIVSRLRDRPGDDRLDRRSDAERVGQDDRALNCAQFVHLRGAGELAEGVADEHGPGHLVPEQVAGVRQDGGHARAHAVALDDRRVADADAGDIGNRVVGARLENSRPDAEIACAGPIGLAPMNQRRTNHERPNDEKHSLHGPEIIAPAVARVYR